MRSRKTRRERECGRKINYPTFKDAQKVADLLNDVAYIQRLKIPVQKLQPYRCGFCSGIHIGHTPRRILERRGVK